MGKLQHFFVILFFVELIAFTDSASSDDNLRTTTIRVGPVTVAAGSRKRPSVQGLPQMRRQQLTSFLGIPLGKNGYTAIRGGQNSRIVFKNGTRVTGTDVWTHHFSLDVYPVFCGVNDQYEVYDRVLQDPYRMILSQRDLMAFEPGIKVMNYHPHEITVYLECELEWSDTVLPETRRVFSLSMFHDHAGIAKGPSPGMPSSSLADPTSPRPDPTVVFVNPWKIPFNMTVIQMRLHVHQGFRQATLLRVVRDAGGMEKFRSNEGNVFYGAPLCSAEPVFGEGPCSPKSGCCQGSEGHPSWTHPLTGSQHDCGDSVTFQKGDVWLSKIVYSNVCPVKEAMMCWKGFYWDQTLGLGYDGSPNRSFKWMIDTYGRRSHPPFKSEMEFLDFAGQLTYMPKPGDHVIEETFRKFSYFSHRTTVRGHQY